MPRVALTIAGFDPSSGAGVSADLMVFAAHGLYGTACITALTVQSTRGVLAVHPVSPALVRDKVDELETDLPPAGVKVGMLADREIVLAAAAHLRRMQTRRYAPVVLDPVLVSSSGHPLLDPAATEALRDELLPLAACITPNRAELAVLIGRPVASDRRTVEAAARELRDRMHPGGAVLVTGGGLDPPEDLLLAANADPDWLPGQHVATSSTHGTGCAFSSALLASLLDGQDLPSAARAAKAYVAGALRFAPGLGSGRGPLAHLWQQHKQAP